jgi:hypothetical protein
MPCNEDVTVNIMSYENVTKSVNITFKVTPNQEYKIAFSDWRNDQVKIKIEQIPLDSYTIAPASTKFYFDTGFQNVDEPLRIEIKSSGGIGFHENLRGGHYIMQNQSKYRTVLVLALYSVLLQAWITIPIVVPPESSKTISKETLIENWKEAYQIAKGTKVPDDLQLRLQYLEQISYGDPTKT